MRERNFSTSIQPPGLRGRTCVHVWAILQNVHGAIAMADSLLDFKPHIPIFELEQTHRALSILIQVAKLGPDGIEVRAVEHGMRLTANSPGAAKVALTGMAPEAGPDKPAFLDWQCLQPHNELH